MAKPTCAARTINSDGTLSAGPCGAPASHRVLRTCVRGHSREVDLCPTHHGIQDEMSCTDCWMETPAKRCIAHFEPLTTYLIARTHVTA
jgi:hypothetical protein